MSSVLVKLVGEKIQTKEGIVDTSTITVDDGQVIGLYFSAHWCPPCRKFTPKLVEFYNKVTKDGKKFLIIFVSADRSQQQFSDYYNEMPWLAIPFGSDNQEGMGEEFGIRGIPTLVLLDSAGKRIQSKSDARTMINADPEGAEFPWST